ncbi:MAG: hypothetical protein ACRELX_14600 [Longimicrobiales bacterium]
MILCLLYERLGSEKGVGEALVSEGVVPRVAVEEERARVWADVRGLPAARVAETVERWGWDRRLTGVRCGVASTPVTAYAAAAVRGGEGGGVEVVAEGRDREYLAPLPLELLEADERLLALLEGVGIETCAALAALEREAVEVRFGADAVRVWQWARAEDARRLFRPAPRQAPSASLDFVDYVVTDPERLLFTANALLGHVCEELAGRGAHARGMTLALALANGEAWRRSIGAARPTASRTAWLRRIRSALERLTVPDAVTGVSLTVDATTGAAAVQGDFFDAGFATAAAVETALERLLEEQGPVVVRPEANAHPLAERRTGFTEESAPARAQRPTRSAGTVRRIGEDQATEEEAGDDDVGLTLQLLEEPRPVLVETIVRRDHVVPVRYRDGTWRAIVTAAGPERVSGGQWETPYAREYYRCVTAAGVLLWIYRNGRDGLWYLHGWWD